MNYIKSVFIVIILFIAAASTSYGQTASTTQVAEAPITSKIKVKGITCSSDVKTLVKAAKALKGVTKCKTLKKGPVSTFEVTFNPQLITQEEIHEAFEDTPGCKNPNDRPYKIKG